VIKISHLITFLLYDPAGLIGSHFLERTKESESSKSTKGNKDNKAREKKFREQSL
jgi:hypothetical protein